MKSLRHITLTTVLLIAVISVASYSQGTNPQPLKKLEKENIKSDDDKDNQDPSTTGLKKLTHRSGDQNKRWHGEGADVDIHIGAIVQEAVNAALESLEPIDIKIKPIEINIEPIEPINIDIEPIEINIEPIEPINIDIEPIEINIEPIEINIEPIEPIEPININIEPFEVNFDMNDIDNDRDDIDTDHDDDLKNDKIDKDKNKDDKEKVKDKEKDQEKKQRKEESSNQKEKSKGLVKIKRAN